MRIFDILIKYIHKLITKLHVGSITVPPTPLNPKKNVYGKPVVGSPELCAHDATSAPTLLNAVRAGSSPFYLFYMVENTNCY